LDAGVSCALDELGDGEVVGADAIERRKRAAKHVVEPVEHAGAFERPEVTHLLHHANQRAVAGRIAAERAGALRVDIAARLAAEDGSARLGKRRSEWP